MRLSFQFELQRQALAMSFQGQSDAQITGIFGPSGAGKTTLLHMIAGIQKAERGYLQFDGHTLFDSKSRLHVPAHARRMGVVFQESRLFPHKTILENLEYGLNLTPVPERRFKTPAIVDLLELGQLLTKRPAQLSGGERQRVALGRAILSSPSLLLLDEPLASLDRGLKRQILPFLRRVKDEIGLPILYVSHDLQELLQLTDQLMIINRGTITAQGAFLDLVIQPEVLSLVHDLGLLNVIPLQIQTHLKNEGCTHFQLTGKQGPVWVGPLRKTPVGATTYAVLRPEDIALVRQTVPDISIRNQIQGVIETIVISDHKALCIVDVGIRLLVELTPNAVHGLDLKKGQSIWCLFKSQALSFLE